MLKSCSYSVTHFPHYPRRRYRNLVPLWAPFLAWCLALHQQDVSFISVLPVWRAIFVYIFVLCLSLSSYLFPALALFLFTIPRDDELRMHMDWCPRCRHHAFPTRARLWFPLLCCSICPDCINISALYSPRTPVKDCCTSSVPQFALVCDIVVVTLVDLAELSLALPGVFGMYA